MFIARPLHYKWSSMGWIYGVMGTNDAHLGQDKPQHMKFVKYTLLYLSKYIKEVFIHLIMPTVNQRDIVMY
jgi:hypothetical protein